MTRGAPLTRRALRGHWGWIGLLLLGLGLGKLRAQPGGVDPTFAPVGDTAALAQSLVQASRASAVDSEAARLFTGACGACHHAGDGPVLLGRNLPLAHYTSLHSAQPDNLLRAVLEGVREPATAEIGFMPAFRDALSDRQVASLAAYLRARFAPAQPPWRDLEATVARIRAQPTP